MTRLLSSILTGTVLLALPLTLNAQTIELEAISDFTNFESGAVPYYLDTAGQRNVLAIDAAIPSYRNKFARAEHEFTGPDGIYDVTINAMGEIDGDGTYRLLVNGIVQGVAVNPPVNVDYTIVEHTFPGIALSPKTMIAVESSAVSNDTIPEGDGYAFARGRWRSVVLSEPEDTGIVITDNAIDLALTLSTVEVLAQDGAQLPIIVSVLNQSESVTATSPVVTFVLPEGVKFASGELCLSTQSGVRCELPEIAPGDVTNTSFAVDITQSGWISISGALNSDQADVERSNNTATLTFESFDAQTDVSTNNEQSTDTTVDSENDASDLPATNPSVIAATADSNDTIGGGQLGHAALLVLVAFGWIRRRSYNVTGRAR